jgi:hypothetical protein
VVSIALYKLEAAVVVVVSIVLYAPAVVSRVVVSIALYKLGAAVAVVVSIALYKLEAAAAVLEGSESAVARAVLSATVIVPEIATMDVYELTRCTIRTCRRCCLSLVLCSLMHNPIAVGLDLRTIFQSGL